MYRSMSMSSVNLDRRRMRRHSYAKRRVGGARFRLRGESRVTEG